MRPYTLRMAKSAKEPKPWTPQQEKRGTPVLKLMSRVNTWVYRRTKGKVGGKYPGGASVCLLSTTGRKTGEIRTVPLIYLAVGDAVVFVASKGGMSQHPLWYLNLAADPEVTVEMNGNRRALMARTATGEEKAELWPKLVAIYGEYDTYQARTDREIPVVICEPAA